MMSIKLDKKPVQTRLEKVVDVLQDYTSVSTIAGVSYFNRNSSRLERIFWSLCLILFLSLAGYNSWQVYADWKNSPWITTLTSAAVPIKELPYPSVTFCTYGTSSKFYTDSFGRRLLNFKIQNKIEKFNITNYYQIKLMLSAFYRRTEDLNELIPETEFAEMYKYMLIDFDFEVNETTVHRILFPHFGNISSIFIRIYMYYLQLKNIEIFTIRDLADRVNMYIGMYFDEAYSSDLQAIKNGKNVLEIESNNVNYSGIFQEIIQHLWYTNPPCFDISDLTGEEDNESSFLRNCKWKGVTINCAAIFSTVPTDVGLCCGFNIMAAEEFFTTSKFTQMITYMQNYDKSLAFSSTDFPDWYLINKEPKSKIGKNGGLQVTLDAHSKLFEYGSVDTDFKSIKVLISNFKDFPLTSQKNLPISMGHRTYIALSGYILKADPSLHIVDTNSKECLFPNEYHLKLFKSYYQLNCFFECSLKYAQAKVQELTNSSRICTPWHFPFTNEEDYTCNSRKRKALFDSMISFIPESQCKICKPDCEYYSYFKTVSKEPLRKCDDLNADVSPYCKFRKSGKIPVVWWQQLQKHFLLLNYSKQQMFRFEEGITSNIRSNSFSDEDHLHYTTFFKETRKPYDAYTQDISVVNIFFDTTTCWKFTTSASSNWTNFISTLGGIFGLFVATSFATLVELVWLIIKILEKVK